MNELDESWKMMNPCSVCIVVFIKTVSGYSLCFNLCCCMFRLYVMGVSNLTSHLNL